jgi:hypothetical protein
MVSNSLAASTDVHLFPLLDNEWCVQYNTVAIKQQAEAPPTQVLSRKKREA